MKEFKEYIIKLAILVLGVITALGVIYALKFITNKSTENSLRFSSASQNGNVILSPANASFDTGVKSRPQQQNKDASPNLNVSGNVLYSFQKAIQQVSPSIVNVYTQVVINDSVVHTYGSGVIMSEQGYILTNYHVIAAAERIAITLNDGTVFPAELVGSDQLTDLAVLKIDPGKINLQAINIPIQDPNIQVGDVVIALGNPLNLGQSATMGIVSALGRSTLDKVGYQKLIQTDVALNTGNSGGALINSQGYLIGINSLVVHEAYGTQVSGLGFAVPFDVAISIMNQIITKGYAEHAYFGAHAEVFSDTNGNNIISVNSIDPNSPAFKAGIRLGDRLLSINGISNADPYKMLASINSYNPGQTVLVELERKGKIVTLNIQLGSTHNNLPPKDHHPDHKVKR